MKNGTCDHPIAIVHGYYVCELLGIRPIEGNDAYDGLVAIAYISNEPCI